MTRRACAFLTALFLLGIFSRETSGAGSPAKSRRAPDFVLLDWQGKKCALSDFQGRVILLGFMQTGCAICQRQAPLLEKLYNDYRDKGVVVIEISHDTGGREAVKAFAEKFGITYPLLLGDLEVAVRYVGASPEHPSFNVPRYFVIDRQGYIVRDIDVAGDANFQSGEMRALEQAIKTGLSSRAPDPALSLPHK